VDSAEVGRGIILASLILTVWTFRKPFYAIYLEYGLKGFFAPLVAPFVAYSKFMRSLRDERNKWADETIKNHRENK
jgi:hypothetical protein